MSATTAELIAWCTDVLNVLGDPSDSAHLIGPLAWAYAEGGWSQNAATYNCWNSTLTTPGSTPINSVGVQAYPSEWAGVAATVSTLRNGLYEPVLAALMAGTPGALATAVGASPWGTPGSAILGCIPRAQAALGAQPPAPKPPAPSPKGEQMIAATSTGLGYWVVKPTGAVFAYGDATYEGGANVSCASPGPPPQWTGPPALAAGDTIVGIAGTGTGGYWLVSAGGAVFAYGSAAYHGGPNES